MKNHFVFDLDDTITNSYEFNQQMFVDTFTPFVPDIDQNYLREFHFFNKGGSMKLQFQDVIKHFNLNIDSDTLLKKNEELHIEKIEDITLFEDIHLILKNLKENGKLISLCSNRQLGSLNKVLKKNKIEGYFDNIVSCMDEGFEKPDPTCFLRIIEKYDLPNEDYIYFGDSKTDAQFATNAGVDYIIIDHYLNQKKFYKLILQSFIK